MYLRKAEQVASIHAPQHSLAGITAMQLDALELGQCRISGEGNVSVGHRLGCCAVRYGDAIGAAARLSSSSTVGMRFGRRYHGAS